MVLVLNCGRINTVTSRDCMFPLKWSACKRVGFFQLRLYLSLAHRKGRKGSCKDSTGARGCRAGSCTSPRSGRVLCWEHYFAFAKQGSAQASCEGPVRELLISTAWGAGRGIQCQTWLVTEWGMLLISGDILSRTQTPLTCLS